MRQVDEDGKIRARMSEIEDQRSQSYVKYPLADILIIVMCAVLCGLDTLEDFVIYTKTKKDFWAKEFGIKGIPSKATFARVLSIVNGKEIGDAIGDILRMQFETEGKVVAVDRKSICSTPKAGNPHSALQILSAYVTNNGVVLAQEAIHEKTNESRFSRKCSHIWTLRAKQSLPTLCTASGKPAAE